MYETWVPSLGWEDPLEEGMATHSDILAWRIPWTEEPGRLYSPQGHKESDTTEGTQHAHMHTTGEARGKQIISKVAGGSTKYYHKHGGDWAISNKFTDA